MKVFPIALGAGVPYRFEGFGRYFRLVSTSAPLDVNLYKRNAIVYPASNVEGGFWATPDDGFDSFELTSAGVQTVYVGVSLGNAGYDRSQGSVQITGPLSGGWLGVTLNIINGNYVDGFGGGIISTRSGVLVEDWGAPSGVVTFKSTAALAANTPENVFGTGSNTFGALIWRAEQVGRTGAGWSGNALVHGTGAPATVFANDPVMMNAHGYLANTSAGTTSGTWHSSKLDHRARIASGRRLDFISTLGEVEGLRHVEYSLMGS